VSRTNRAGLTLIEVLIVIAILAIIVAIVYPNLFPPETTSKATTEASLIEQAKALALSRAEPMRLSVERDGAWQIASEATPTSVIATGRLPEAPADAFALRVTELGACLPVEGDRQVEGRVVDAVSCTVRP
jgi:prepilin-type N-terminal cleavage/methylation domain-containing protein